MVKARGSRVAKAFPVLMIICLIGFPARAKYGGGLGTWEEPYLIEIPEHLNAIGADPNDWDKHFQLTADIDLSAYQGNSFNLIGSSGGSRGRRAFSGTFRGDGHTVSNFSSSSTEPYSVGLFAYVFGTARIENLHLVRANINAPKATGAGALVGSLYDPSYSSRAVILNCSAEDVNVTGESNVGGLIGEGSGSLMDCCSTGAVRGNFRVGGLVGYARNHTITGCHFDGEVSALRSGGALLGENLAYVVSCDAAGSVTGRDSIGGFVGHNNHMGRIMSCSSTAEVAGTNQDAGGFVGTNSDRIKYCRASGTARGDRYVGGFAGSNSYLISHCYATGAVKGNRYVGGFAGGCSSSILMSYSTGAVSGIKDVGGFGGGGPAYLCYWDTQASGIAYIGSGRGRTTAEMMSTATFAGWGFENQWVIQEGVSYPRLVWEKTGGTLLVDPPRLYGGGTGEPNDPYRIATREQLLLIACYHEDQSKHFLLTRDLDFRDLEAGEFVPMGTGLVPFTGSFDGDGHTIRNFTGPFLFGTIDPKGSVRELHLSEAQVSGGQIGALAAYNHGSIQGCSVTGVVTGTHNVGGLVGNNGGRVEACATDVRVSGESSVGGLAGYNGGSISACSAAGRVAGQSSCGGLVGYNDKEVNASYSTAEVTGETDVGGLVGTAGTAGFWMICPAPPPYYVPTLSGSRITACYSLGQVTGQKSLGGLIGKNAGAVMGCYAACPIPMTAAPPKPGQNADPDIGGLVGKNEYGIVHLSYWDTEVSGLTRSAGGRGKTTAQMATAETFRGWSSFQVWALDEGHSYPYFQWAESSGEPIADDPYRYGGGDGTSAAPYQIRTPTHLARIGCYPTDWDKAFILMSDLDLETLDPNTLWPTGTLTRPFAGSFDGGGHTIANFTYRSDSELYIGLFGSIGGDLSQPAVSTGEVLSLNLKDVDICGYCYVGALAAQSDGTISSCSVTGQVRATYKNAGGLVGFNGGTVRDCSSTCTVTAQQVAGTLTGYNAGSITSAFGSGTVRTTDQRDSYAGGLVGQNDGNIRLSHFVGRILGGYTAGGLVALNEGTISMCSARATVTGSYLLGGLVGYNECGRTISRSFADGTTSGGNATGGLVGHNAGSISNCFAAGLVRGDERIGGLVGSCSDTVDIQFCYSTCLVNGRSIVAGFIAELPRGGKVNVTSCFWDVDSSATADGVATADPDPSGVSGLRSANMQIDAVFAAAWDITDEMKNDIENIWWLPQGQDYPRLSWARAAGTDDVSCGAAEPSHGQDGYSAGGQILDFSQRADSWR